MGRGDEDYDDYHRRKKRVYMQVSGTAHDEKKTPSSVELVNDDMYKATTERLRNQSSPALKRKREASVVHSK
jgi:hypothetical protein